MNLLTGVFSMILCAAIGILKSRVLEQRVIQLEEILVMLEKIQTFLSYEKTPTRELIFKLAHYDGVRHLQFLQEADKHLEQTKNFPEVWKKSIETVDHKLTKDDQKMLSLIGDILGGSDVRNQMKELLLVENLAQQAYEQAIGEQQQKGKLYRSLGVLSGIGIAVLLI